MSKPLVSICIPVYNGEATIKTCLKAVLAQDVEDAEILIVDNCSTDRTVEIVERVIQGVPNARLIRNETNIGRIENWNRCLEVAQGKYLKFALANDALKKGNVRILVGEAIQDDEIVLVCSWHTWSHGIPDEIPEMEPPRNKKCFTNIETLKLVNDTGNPFWALNGMLINLETVRTRKLQFPVDMPQLADVHFCTQLASFGKTMFLESSSYLFNKGATNRFHFANVDLAKSFLQIRRCIELAASLLKTNGIYVEAKVYPRLFDSFKHVLYDEKISINYQQVLSLFSGRPIWQTRGIIELIVKFLDIRGRMTKLKLGIKQFMPFLIPVLKKLRSLQN